MHVVWDATPPESRPRPWQPPLVLENFRDKLEALQSRRLFENMDDAEVNVGSLEKGTPTGSRFSKKGGTSEGIPFRKV